MCMQNSQLDKISDGHNFKEKLIISSKRIVNPEYKCKKPDKIQTSSLTSTQNSSLY